MDPMGGCLCSLAARLRLRHPDRHGLRPARVADAWRISRSARRAMGRRQGVRWHALERRHRSTGRRRAVSSGHRPPTPIHRAKTQFAKAAVSVSSESASTGMRPDLDEHQLAIETLSAV